jgi:hypothetical protein
MRQSLPDDGNAGSPLAFRFTSKRISVDVFGEGQKPLNLRPGINLDPEVGDGAQAALLFETPERDVREPEELAKLHAGVRQFLGDSDGGEGRGLGDFGGLLWHARKNALDQKRAQGTGI